MDGDADFFDDVVFDEGTVDGSEGKRVVDEEGHTTPCSLGAVTVEEVVARDVDVDIGG